MHLGEALVAPVSRRVSKLTGGAYGEGSNRANAVAPEHRGRQRQPGARGVAGRDLRPDYTVRRITIAEKLSRNVVLDDQLVQSDGSRMRWLYAFMRRRRSQDGNGPRAPNCLSR